MWKTLQKTTTFEYANLQIDNAWNRKNNTKNLLSMLHMFSYWKLIKELHFYSSKLNYTNPNSNHNKECTIMHI